eukprot:CAMPEP_0202887226 /NCGR_PEP_ID=MMETSP1391-20130828/42574_1 /ASSEMBLY_ACC=CAM_ASM_000867 /TAXON_ID=1034604 /ORGANISM="Chlamydomonas leiostraca, Strain SAG 11-49" /LENGTH=261 /DNA_ID=CAMNT_0049570507 /DNA_START=130 /DNA_END=915 /DNA_ORIENTATION=-
MTVTNYGKKPRRGVRCLLFDLDDCLYRAEEVPRACRAAIERYMVEHLGISKDKVSALTSELYLKYGTTMAGLAATGYKIDYDAWHEAVHHKAIDYHHLLHPDVLLREILCSIDLPKYVLTNADRKHAEICLARMGITDCFQGVFHFEWVNESAAKHGLLSPSHPVMCKPLPKTYELVLEAIGCDAREVIFFDDSARNVQAAHELGLMTVCVGREEPLPGADLVVASLHQLPSLLPELFDQPGLVRDGHHGAGSDLVVAVEL